MHLSYPPNVDKFRVGLEFEFIVPRADRLLDVGYKYLKTTDLDIGEAHAALETADKLRPVYAVLKKCQWDAMDRYHGYDESIPPNTSVPRIILAMRLRSINGWYIRKKVSGKFIYEDQTEQIQSLIDTVDLDDSNAVSDALKKISNVYVVDHVEEYTDYVLNNAMPIIAKAFSQRLGVEITALTDVYIEENRGALDYHTYSDTIAKNVPGWYLKAENGLDGIEFHGGDIGVEIVTPPLHPVVSSAYAHLITKLMNTNDLGFTVKTTKDCAVHVNVSCSELKWTDYSPTFWGIIFDTGYEVGLCRRHDDETYDFKKEITRAINDLINAGLLQQYHLDTPEGIIGAVALIDSAVEANQYRLVEFGKLKHYGYIEHKYFGGEDYPRYYDSIDKSIHGIISATNRYKNFWEDDYFVAELRKMVEGAPYGDWDESCNTFIFPKVLYSK